MIRTEFKVDGTVYCRGEEAFKYKAGDKVVVLHEIDDESVQILVTEGEATGEVMPTEKALLKY